MDRSKIEVQRVICHSLHKTVKESIINERIIYGIMAKFTSPKRVSQMVTIHVLEIRHIISAATLVSMAVNDKNTRAVIPNGLTGQIETSWKFRIQPSEIRVLKNIIPMLYNYCYTAFIRHTSISNQ